MRTTRKKEKRKQGGIKKQHIKEARNEDERRSHFIFYLKNERKKHEKREREREREREKERG